MKTFDAEVFAAAIKVLRASMPEDHGYLLVNVGHLTREEIAEIARVTGGEHTVAGEYHASAERTDVVYDRVIVSMTARDSVAASTCDRPREIEPVPQPITAESAHRIPGAQLITQWSPTLLPPSDYVLPRDQDDER